MFMGMDWSAVFDIVFQVENFLMIAIGVLIGVLFAAIPGLTGAIAIGIILPFTYYMEPVPAISLIMGIFKGGMFGGSISAITFGTPGTPEAAADVLDGYPMTKSGRPYKALTTALYSSVIGELLATLVLIFTFEPLAEIALKFGPRELFALLVFALGLIIIFAGHSPLKALIAVGIGMIIGQIGTDPISGTSRLTFGSSFLRDGISLIPFLIGLFAFSELMVQFGQLFKKRLQNLKEDTEERIDFMKSRKEDDHLSLREFITYYKEVLIGFVLGTFVGALPGPGSTLSAYSSYAIAQRFSKNRENFGKGAPQGIAAAESGNSATSGSTLIPLFALGIPGSSMAALVAGAFMLQGITPGPGMAMQYSDIIYAIFIMILIGSFINLIVSRFSLPLFTRLGLITPQVLIPILILFCVLGVFSYHQRFFDVLILLAAGFLGLLLRKFSIPLSPVLLAYIVVPLLEVNFRRGTIISNDASYFFSSSIAITLYLVLAIFLFFTLGGMKLFKRGEKKENDIGKGGYN
jgi:putative tricarboxylic transport membrane protein